MNNVKSRITAFDFWAEWVSTGILMVGIILTAYNVYPLGIWFSMIGNFGWFVVATIWKKWSLIAIQLMAVLIYISGLLSHYGVL
jgi:hypothetical protein